MCPAPVPLPDPGQAATFDDLVEQLRSLKVWAGAPSYERITAGINAEWAREGRPEAEMARKTTVVDCFRFRNKIGLDVAVGALNDAVKNKGVSSRDILRYARACRMQNVILPYLEAIQ